MAELYEILGKGALRLGASKIQTLTDASDVKLTCFDVSVIERGDIAVDAVAGTLTYTGIEPKHCTLAIGINADFLATEEIMVMAYVNGAPYSGNYLHLQGAGAGKPVSIYWKSELTLTAGAVVEIRGRNSDSGDFDITYTRATLVLEEDG